MTIDLNALREDLPNRRWFPAKHRTISDVRVLDSAVVSEGDEDLVLALVTVTFDDGGEMMLHLPLLVSENGQRDISEDPNRLRVLGEALAHGHPIKGEHGIFHMSGPGLDPENPPGVHSAWMISGEQSNSSVVLDDAAILKLFRKVEPGPNPDLELARLLTNEGFRSIPEQVGEIFYESQTDEDSVPESPRTPDIDLGIAQRFIPGGKEGWELTLEMLGGLLSEIHEADAPEDMPQLIEERAADLMGAVAQLGEATATLHVTLAREDFEDEFRPEAVLPETMRRWVDQAQLRVDQLSERSREIAGMRARISERLGAVLELEDAGMMTRIHGDYHLGQVLRVPRAWYILDLEGEPAKTLEERRSKHSPLKDVAGMLRSLSYAAHAALREGDEQARAGHVAWMATWEELARERFTSAYLARAHEGRFLPSEHTSIDQLLSFFELDKALYELEYELGSRPDWASIPLKAITTIIERGDR
jgi:maltokinase